MREPVHHPYPLAPESRIRRTSLHPFCNLVLGLAMVFPIQGVAYDQEYYVNQRNDAPDFNLLDGVPDSKEFVPGLQTTLRAALMQAAWEGGTTLITFTSGVHTNFDQQFINSDVTLRGLGPGQTIIDGNHVSRVISVGDLYDRTNYTVRIENLTIRNGTLSIPQNCEGAGIFNWWSTVTLSNVVVEGNVSAGSDPQYSYGGGIANINVMTLQGCTVQSNVANGVGGGIYNSAHGRMDIYDTTIHANQGASGGGIHNKSPCTITGSTLSSNHAGSEGGAIHNSGGSALSELTNCTVSDNSAGLRGGAIYSWYGGCTLRHVTVAHNEAPTGGGIYHNSAAPHYYPAAFRNTILAHNSGGNVAGILSNVDDDGGNLSTDGTAGITVGDPLLGPLTDNTGPTLTHALFAGSDAIDAGDPAYAVPVDQRGVARPQDGDGDAIAVIDSGAYEAAGVPPLPAPEINVQPASYDFGNLPLGTSSPPLEVVIENTGTLVLNVTDIALSDTDNYVLDLNGGSDPAGSVAPSIHPGLDRTVTVTFFPQTAGVRPCDLTIASDDADEPLVTVSFSGASAEPPQPPSLALEFWEDLYDSGEGNDYVWGVAIDSTGTVIAAGYREENVGQQDQTARLKKYGPNGWTDEMEMGPTGTTDKPHSNDHFYDVTTDSNDNVIVVGQQSGGWSLGYLGRMVTRKYTPGGTQLWERLLPDSGYWSVGRGLELTDDGDILIAGSSYINSGGLHQWATMGYDADGNALAGFPVIYKHYPSAGYEYAYDIAVGPSNQFVVVGFVGNAAGNYDWHVRAYAADLSLDWSDTFNGISNLNDSAQGVTATPDGNYVVGGYSNKGTDNGSGNDYDWLLIKYRASDGQRLWTRTLESGGWRSEICYDVTVDGVGNILCAGYGRDALDTACWRFCRLDAETGAVIAAQQWAATANQVIYALAYRDRTLAFGGWSNNGTNNDQRVSLAVPPPSAISTFSIAPGGDLFLEWEGAFEKTAVYATPILEPPDWQMIVPPQIDDETMINSGTASSRYFSVEE